MRYDTPVYLQTKQQGVYRPETGDYAPSVMSEYLVYGSVSANDAGTTAHYYGTIKNESLTVHFKNHLPPFDFVRIGSKRYRADSVENLRKKTVVVLSEVH